MKRQIARYTEKLIADGSVDETEMAVLANDDKLLGQGSEEYLELGRAVLEQLNVVSLVVARPAHPLLEVLLDYLPLSDDKITPLDTETRTFLHDIPLVRQHEFTATSVDRLVAQLGQRKGVLIEGVGIMVTGSVTVEQAYINYSSVYHALYVKVLLDLIQQPVRRRLEQLEPLWRLLKRPIPIPEKTLVDLPLDDHETILGAVDEAGKATVNLHLVDSFFGNISCYRGGQLYISQTGASLDSLAGCIDQVPDNNTSTAGITASSELIAHRAIYQQTDARTILHGHPKLSVILSLLCEEKSCKIVDCWKDCEKIRYLDSAPIVAGEVGAGGIAKRVPPVIGASGIAVVYGHGVFAIGRRNFNDPLRAMIALENWCRAEYLRRLLKNH